MPKAASAKTIKKALATVNRARKASRVSCRKASKGKTGKCSYRKGSRKASRKSSKKSRKASRKSSKKSRKASRKSSKKSRKASRKSSKRKSKKSRKASKRRNAGEEWSVDQARGYLARGVPGTYQEYVNQCKTGRPSDVRAWARADNVYIPSSAKNRRQVCESLYFSRDLDRALPQPVWNFSGMRPSHPRWQQLKHLAASNDTQGFLDACNQTGMKAIRKYGKAFGVTGSNRADICSRLAPGQAAAL